MTPTDMEEFATPDHQRVFVETLMEHLDPLVPQDATITVIVCGNGKDMVISNESDPVRFVAAAVDAARRGHDDADGSVTVGAPVAH